MMNRLYSMSISIYEWTINKSDPSGFELRKHHYSSGFVLGHRLKRLMSL